MSDPNIGRTLRRTVRVSDDTFRRLQEFVKKHDMDRLRTRPDDVIRVMLDVMDRVQPFVYVCDNHLPTDDDGQ